MTLPATMKTLQLKPGKEFGEAVLTVPAPKSDEVLIRTDATTICTSDINDIDYNPWNLPLPIVLGHEGAGTVAAVGEKVTDFKIGDKVVSHPVIPCGACVRCRTGLAHLCDNMGHLGFDRNGTFAEYYAIPARCVRKIPQGVDAATAALLEPIAVCIEAVRRARVEKGQTVVVCGDGPFGILIARLALNDGADVILAGKEPFRLGQVPQAFRVNLNETPDLTQVVRERTHGNGASAAILAVDAPRAVNACLHALAPRGRLVIFANFHENAPVDLAHLHMKEMEILGACNDEDYTDESLALLTSPVVNAASLVTHRLPFDRWKEAFELASKRKHEALKVAITFP